MITDKALWAAIEAHTFDQPGAAMPFSKRLARDNGWSQTFADEAITEYRRFIYLVCTADTMLTPSQTVDEVWHLHLLYTRDYWDVFCGRVLKRSVHHGPGEGGAEEDALYRDAYAATRRLYRQAFGHEPPPVHWPAPKPAAPSKSAAFHVPFRQVFLCLAAAGAALTLAACEPVPVVDDVTRHPVLLAIAVAFLVILTAARLSRPAAGRRKKDDGSGCSSSGCGGGDSGGGSCCGSGCGSGCGGGCGGS